MTSPAATLDRAVVPEDASGVLSFARAQREIADTAEANLLLAAVRWAVIHPAQSLDDAESFATRVHLAGADDQPVTLAGPGAPLVAEFGVAEFAAAVGLPTEAGKRYVGHALELAYRLPRLWARVQAGDLAAWKARRVAHETIGAALSSEAARFVDTHVAPVAHKIRPAQLDRLVAEAIARHMPQTAERRRREAADGRHFTIDHTQVSFAGTSQISGELDLADALDLDDAIRGLAAELADLGSTDPLEVRRSLAAGELARRQLTLHLTPEQPAPDRDRAPRVEVRGFGTGDAHPPQPTSSRASKPRPVRRPVRRTVLYLHLSEAALGGQQQGAGGGDVGRVENTRSPVTAEQIRQWCGHPATHLTIRPVLDLADHISVDAYEVPDRIKEAIALRDHSCVFPWCTRPARTLRPDQHACDCDHVVPYDPGGPPGQTCTCRLAPLCRTHHRLKTHSAWTYTILEPGSYLWTSPHGYHYLRDHTGSLDVSRDQPSPHGEPPRD